MNDAAVIVLSILGGVVWFLCLWCGVIWLVAALGGWRRLASHYAAASPPIGTRYRFRSGKLGLSNYGGCLTIHTTQDGIHLAVLWPFRIAHPPLFIPWSELHDPRVRWGMVAFRVGTPKIATLQLPQTIIAEHLAAEEGSKRRKV